MGSAGFYVLPKGLQPESHLPLSFGLPISVEDIEPEEIVKLTLSDKKMDAGNIKFILLKKIGKAVISLDVTKDDMIAAVNEIFYSEEEHYE